MNRRTDIRLVVSLLASVVLISAQAGTAVPGGPQELSTAGPAMTLGARLRPTLHPTVPEALESMWYAASKTTPVATPLSDLAKAVRMLEQSGDAAAALPLLTAGALVDSDVALYARYYSGIALQRLNRLDAAEAAFASVASQKVEGYLPEAAALRQAEVRETRGDYTGAEQIYEGLVQRTLASPQTSWLKLGMMAEMNGHRGRAREAFSYVRDTFPLTQEATEADLGLDRIKGVDLATPAGVARELARADTLFTARRTALARNAYGRLRGQISGDDHDLVLLRLAILDAQSGKARTAREAVRRYVGHPRLARGRAVRDARDHAGSWHQRRVPVARPWVCHPVPCRLVHRRSPERSGQTLRARR